MAKLVPFSDFNNAVNKQFAAMVASGYPLVRLDVSGDEVWDKYIASFPEGTNKMFRERLEYDCNCCKSFVRRIGNIVALTPSGYMTVWDNDVKGYYATVATALHSFLQSFKVKESFLTTEPYAGSRPNLDPALGTTWTHFYLAVPKQFISSHEMIGTLQSNINGTITVLSRSMDELTLDAAESVLELINQDSIYRGLEHKPAVVDFIKLKKAYDKLKTEKAKTHFVWHHSIKDGMKCRFRNTVIGTLVDDISSGVSLEKAVASFESKVAPANYKRTSAPTTPSMIKGAQNKIVELGLQDAIPRRFACPEDIDIKNILFSAQTNKSLNVFDDLMDGALSEVDKRSLAKVEEVSLDHFIKNVLPSATSVELLFENNNINNLMSLLTSVDPDAPRLFKWDNNFSWSYNNDVADTLRQRVADLGGRVDGPMRFSHSWNHTGENQSLMDLHLFMPACNLFLSERAAEKQANPAKKEIHNKYPGSYQGSYIGWNRRIDSHTGGSQDVDHTAPPGKFVPVENIAFKDIRKMPEGVYTFKIHNWQAREPNKTGFKAEIELNGELYQYERKEPVAHHEWITLAEVTLKNGQFSIQHMMESTYTSNTVWGIDTNKWVKVNNIMLSPNYWNDNASGNKHLFFIIDQCKNPDSARGIYNEFLRPELEQHRKVFELLGSKTKAEPSENQVSGVGFSSTIRGKITVRVSGKTKRVFVVNM